MRKRRPSALLKPELHLRIFVEEVRDYAVLTLDPEGVVRSWNSGAKAIKGYEADEIIGRNFSVFYTPEDRRARKPQRCLRMAARHGRFYDMGERVRKDGSRFFADVVITPIVNSRGRLLGFGKITRDVSERTQSVAATAASEARLRSLVDTVVDTLVDGLIVIDRNGIVQSYNRACQSLFGYPAHEVVGKNVKMLMPPAFGREHDRYLENYHRTGVRKIIGISREVTGRRRDGTVFPMHLAVGETQQDGQPIYVGVIRDLTQRNRTEEQLRQSQKMEAVGQLTGGIAHDFNNILMVILANTEALLEEAQVDGEVQRRVEQVGKAAGRAAELTKQLLAFSRKQTLQPEPTDINVLVSTTSRLLRRTLGEDIEIMCDLAADLWIADIDRAQLESALVNLSLNARDAMPDGGRLIIETRNEMLDADYVGQNPDAREGDYVMLSVTDTGKGIPADILPHVFEPFFTTKDVGRGTGLGLSMVYGFTKQSNGHIKIYSEAGRGTAIRLYLPRGPQRSGSDVVASSSAVANPSGNERVLLVEDNEQVRENLVQQLKGLGYRVVEAVDGAAGLAACDAAVEPYDLLLTDIVMPGEMNGVVLAEAVRKRWPSTAVILMSGYSDKALMHGMSIREGTRLLTKPFRKAQLAAAVRSALDAGRPGPARRQP